MLDFLSRTVLQAGVFVQTKAGKCRLHPQLARAVVASCWVPQARLDVQAHWLRERLLAGA